jgi:hypothetical protein
MYEEFGGANLLSRITNIGVNTIIGWFKEYKTDPNFH